jgi:MscS family membrane protein
MDTNVSWEITFGLDRFSWWRGELLGNPLYRYLVFFGYVLAAVILAKLADVVMRSKLRQTTEPTSTAFREKLVELFRGPLKLVVFVMLLHLGVQPMHKPEWMQRYLNNGFTLLVAIAITYTAMRSTDVAFEVLRARFRRRDPRTQMEILTLLSRSVKIFIFATAVLVTADNLGIKVGGFLATFGLTGLAVAMASQETLSNLLGSIVILADRPFALGDRVKIGGDEGVVECIGVRSTILRTTEGDTIAIPNRNIVNTPVRNFSKSSGQASPAPPTG